MAGYETVLDRLDALYQEHAAGIGDITVGRALASKKRDELKALPEVRLSLNRRLEEAVSALDGWRL